jgi:hypothetical protein
MSFETLKSSFEVGFDRKVAGENDPRLGRGCCLDTQCGSGLGLTDYGFFIFFFLFLILIWYGCYHFFFFFFFFAFFKKLMMCHIIIECYKKGVIRMDLIIGALLGKNLQHTLNRNDFQDAFISKM